MYPLSWILLFCLLLAVLSVLAAAVFLIMPQPFRERAMPHLISFATGALLGVAFVALLPHALETPGLDDYHRVTMTVLAGVLVFFLLEKMVLWRHCHTDDCEAHVQETEEKRGSMAGPLVLVGDGIHNLIHGILIAAAFFAGIHVGVVTTLAVAAHQIPQELSNFAVLLHSGFDRGRALVYNILSSLPALVGGVLGYYGMAGVQWLVPYMLAVAAASCIYIAVADLIPGLHQRAQLRATVEQVLLICLGVGSIYVTHALLD